MQLLAMASKAGATSLAHCIRASLDDQAWPSSGARRYFYLAHSAADCAAVGRAAGSPVPGLAGDQRVGRAVDAKRVWCVDPPSTAIRHRLGNRKRLSACKPLAAVSVGNILIRPAWGHAVKPGWSSQTMGLGRVGKHGHDRSKGHQGILEFLLTNGAAGTF